MADSIVRVAAVHAAAPFLDLSAGVAKTCEFIREAGRADARLVVFPETFLPGYPYWIWSHTAKYAAPLFAELHANSIELPSPESDAIGAAAREAGVWVVLGVNERARGTLYNSQVYFGPDGRLLARHRKLQPTNAERTVWGRGDGRDIFVVDTGFARLGGLICFEHSMDLPRYALATLGEQIHVAAWPAINATHADPNAGDFDHYSATLAQAHAICSQTFVVISQGLITQEIIDKLGVPDGPDAPSLGGGMTGFVGPNGKWLAKPHRDTEKIVTADLELDTIRFAKFFADGAGHYARPDVFRFGIDRTAQTPLSTQVVDTVAPLMPAEGDASEIGTVLSVQ
ncbi:aliphatic nitrilase [Tamaricihabitans halophyticus]|uniref:Aliphatic nitrilase n=1 Tax=Tamaricihabitans halophyticus TaxID=1262583 RepID=A0A4R2R4R5_9PSEU|nr:carbon-nitrogen hydrolase family protein [Tamaricihabitans halophyticus]TCP56997.1 aliphatic nitrilase [Tamaricihabitans halophyticus]